MAVARRLQPSDGRSPRGFALQESAVVSAAPPSWRAWTVWTVAAIFYLAAFYLRTSPAVMTTELMR
ncbi:MAG TPA: hypothetical protein VKD69_26955, partial [Vicinamibacterales bacterium]|nr:hypothetical protein [Vicinamibacterales bacterium]